MIDRLLEKLFPVNVPLQNLRDSARRRIVYKTASAKRQQEALSAHEFRK